MQEFMRDYEIEMNGVGYVVYESGDVIAKDGHALSFRELVFTRKMARDLDAEVRKEIAEISKYMPRGSHISYDLKLQRWFLSFYYGSDQNDTFTFETLQDLLFVLKKAKKLYRGRNSRDFVAAMILVLGR